MDRLLDRLLPALLAAMVGCGVQQTTVFLDLTRVPADLTADPVDELVIEPDLIVGPGDDGGTSDEDLATPPLADLVMKTDLVAAGDLTMAPPVNDTCTGAMPLTFVTGKATFTSNTNAAVADTSGTCGGSGPDVVYMFTTTQARKITVVAVPMGSPTYEPLVYLRKVCNSTLAGNELGCHDAGANGATAMFTVDNAPAGTYWVWIDGFAGSKGIATVTVTQAAPTVPPDTCALVAPITLGQTLTGDTATAGGDMGGLLSGACAGMGIGGQFAGRDLVYAFTPTASGTVTVTLHPTAAWDPALWMMHTSCVNDGSSCIAADDTGFDSDDETLTFTVVAARPYYLVVDSYSLSASSGPFTIRVQ